MLLKSELQLNIFSQLGVSVAGERKSAIIPITRKKMFTTTTTQNTFQKRYRTLFFKIPVLTISRYGCNNETALARRFVGIFY